MSHYKTLKIKLESAQHIRAALEALRESRGIDFEEDVMARGYGGVHFPSAFVIRKRTLQAHYGDLAIVQNDAGYEIRVDELDYARARIKAVVGAIRQNYAVAKAHAELAAQGYVITSQRNTAGKVVITATPPRRQTRARRSVRVRR